ncbi:hypothetical protein [Benzoatithermus flavus]|uniref:Transposase n=1 Tax=Benzoatithermus flavus TaxID=3108223 RepID=A0ABU8XWT5_9PROT
MRILRSLEDQAAYLECRKRELGLPLGPNEAARNKGRRRTDSKRALLRKLAEEASRSGRAVPMLAVF